MIFPSIEQLTKDRYNRYELVIETAKAARVITDEKKKKKEEIEKSAGKESSQNEKIIPTPKEVKDIPEEKPVKSAIVKIYEGEFIIVLD
jgi:hypothetical protein